MAQWGLSVLAASIAFALMELLLPDSEIAKFAKVGFGLIMMILILKPVVTVVADDFTLFSGYTALKDDLDKKIEEYNHEEHEVDGQNLYIFDNNLNIDMVVEQLKAKLTEHVVMIGIAYEVEITNVAVDICEEGNKQFGTVLNVEFTHNECKNDKISKVIDEISNDFKLDKNLIRAEVE